MEYVHLVRKFHLLDDPFRPVALEVDDTNQMIFVGTQTDIRLISMNNGTVRRAKI